MSTIKVNGMSCQHCVMSVTKALEALDGIRNVTVSLEKGEARFDEDKPVDRDVLIKAIEKIGFTTGD